MNVSPWRNTGGELPKLKPVAIKYMRYHHRRKACNLTYTSKIGYQQTTRAAPIIGIVTLPDQKQGVAI